MPAPGVSYFPTASSHGRATAPAPAVGGSQQPAPAAGAKGVQVVSGVALGPFTFGADSPIGKLLLNANEISTGFASSNAAYSAANPSASPADYLTHAASSVGALGGTVIGDIAQVGGALLGQEANSAGPGLGMGGGALVAGLGTGASAAATAAGPGVSTGVAGATTAFTGLGGSIISGLGKGLFGAAGGTGSGFGLVTIALAGLLVLLLLLK